MTWWRRRQPLPARALELLREGTGNPRAAFRPGQAEAIAALLEPERRLLVVQRTGWGKSAVYFIAARLLREAGAGPTVIVSPLLALMRNQVAAARRMGLTAAAVHSENRGCWGAVEAALAAGGLDLLLLSPERLARSDMLPRLVPAPALAPALWVIDEAHCLSDWGHDFRPSFRLLAPMLMEHAASARVLATTATVNERVLDDLRCALGADVALIRGPLARPDLALQVIHLPRRAQRLAWLAAAVPDLPGSGIVYTLTVADAEMLAGWLRSVGIEAEAYSGRSGDRRGELESALLANRIKVLVATSALGMGFDKPDLGWVVHFQMPPSPLTYYQQVGRAGRALPSARGVLLRGEEDVDIGRHLVRGRWPAAEERAALLDALDRCGRPCSVTTVATALQRSVDEVRRWLQWLASESQAPVRREPNGWVCTGHPLAADLDVRIEARRAQRRAELEQMQRYVTLERGHMAYLVRLLGGRPPRSCESPLPPLLVSFPPACERRAARWLEPPSVPLPAVGTDDHSPHGRALTAGDDGWLLATVFACKHRGRRVPERLVRTCRDLLLGWQPDPAPCWVTCVPSLRHPHWLPELAWRLGAALDLPFREVLVQVRPRPPAGRGAGSVDARSASLAQTFAWTGQPPLPGPVLLLDDLIYTGATLARVAALLAGRGVVTAWPLLLISFLERAPPAPVQTVTVAGAQWGQDLRPAST